MVQQFKSCVCVYCVLLVRTGYWHICICKSYKICLCRLVISNRNTQNTYFFQQFVRNFRFRAFDKSTQTETQQRHIQIPVFPICCCTSYKLPQIYIEFYSRFYTIFYKISSSSFFARFFVCCMFILAGTCQHNNYARMLAYIQRAFARYYVVLQ